MNLFIIRKEKIKKLIEDDLVKAVKGEHKCSDPNCLIKISAPIAAEIIDNKVGMENLVGLIFFCNLELQKFPNIGKYRQEEINMDVQEFQNWLKKLKEIIQECQNSVRKIGTNEYTNEYDERELEWISLGEMAGKTKEAIFSLMKIHRLMDEILAERLLDAIAPELFFNKN